MKPADKQFALAVLTYVLYGIMFWLWGSSWYSYHKASTGNCDYWTPVEYVLDGDWFC